MINTEYLHTRECKNLIKLLATAIIIMSPMSIVWADWHDYIDELAIGNDGVIVDDEEFNLIILIALLILQWLPLYIMFRFTLFVTDYISYKKKWVMRK